VTVAKGTGLGNRFYFGGYDISGDVQAVGKCATGGTKTIDLTDITESAFERALGEFDGQWAFTSYFDKTNAHIPLSALPRTDVQAMFAISPSIGADVACMVAKQTDYPPTRGSDGSLTMAVTAQSNAFGYEWGKLLTAGVRTDTGATNGTSFDIGNGMSAPSVPASGTPVSNPTSVPVTVVISGGTMSNVVINGVSVGTGAGTYTLPPGASITLTYSVAPTWTWTISTAYGAQMYLQVMAFTGTDATVTVQDSADNTTFTNIASGGFAQVTSSPQGQRIALTNTATVRRYLRVATTTSGGFTSLRFVVAVDRNIIAGVAF
jgi:hypothetical protein